MLKIQMNPIIYTKFRERPTFCVKLIHRINKITHSGLFINLFIFREKGNKLYLIHCVFLCKNIITFEIGLS